MKILIIDDEIGIRTSLKFAVQNEGFDVLACGSGEEGLLLFEKFNPDITILDIHLPGKDGIEVLKEIKNKKSSAIVIMITYLSDIRLAVNAMKLGAYDYFTKPFSIKEVKEAILKVSEYKKIKTSLDEDELGQSEAFVGKSKKIIDIKKKIKKIVNMNIETAILITGASGTGKEVLAKYIHELKYQNQRPYVAINCAAIPQNLQESEFFGYEKGAFTEAKGRKTGLIENANGGTLFLDEIGDMDIDLQAKMLRVLQEKKFRRVGGLAESDFSALIVAATNKNLKEEIKKGRFREDLYYRLNVIPIEMPDLKDRQEDIEYLIDYFIKEYNTKLGKNVLGFEESAFKRMLNYNWPGNVRELKNLIERLMIFADEELIKEEELPDDIISDLIDETKTDHRGLENAEAKVIMDVLIENQWNITKTSERLGISRLTLRRKIEKYSLERPFL
ncbi:DNA-binding NtrC family response regulator [Acetoanaerobium pronyense]|uniref:Stage 0 sporulation protein A homolog n=1 Tax=Acetoanaerobium pronyense TaxID=1482736 RepID=A0ABS4KES8_9FIRM|nr:sigma-54 dependent transcriptional regulator [Acetoanaerobium pronyense]MBP2026276.1 DNA-binding NtrC family response regulator [Acetoanaerobium pronyense]